MRKLLQEKWISGAGAVREYCDLLDLCFKVPAGSHFFDDFPVWNPDLNILARYSLGLFVQSKVEKPSTQQLVGTASLRLAAMRTPAQKEISVAVIGAVATHPDWRGKGVASRLVSSLTHVAQEKGASAVVLWGSEHALYQKLGYELCGQQICISLQEIELRRNRLENLEVKVGWNSSLFDLVRRRKGGFVLREEDRFWYEAHRNVEWYSLGSTSQPKAYVGVGRGIDLQGMIHEWGGEPDFLSALLDQIKKKNPRLTLLGDPEQVVQLGIPLEKGRAEFLCLSRILNPSGLLQSYYPDLLIKTDREGENWRIQLGSQVYPLLNDRALARLIFGAPLDDRPVEPNSLLPVSFWVWGLDGA